MSDETKKTETKEPKGSADEEPKETADEEESKEPQIQMEWDRYFLEWLKREKCSILASSYKMNHVFCIGITKMLEPQPNEQLSFWMTQGTRCMGATSADDGKSVWVGSMSFLTKYCLTGEETDEGDDFKRTPFDAYYIPRKIHVTNDIDIHDIVVPSHGTPHFISAVFSCVCVPSEDKSFKVYWKPPWVSKIAAEDRTHLNGLCMVNNVPRFVTACAQTDIRGGWREHKRDGGVVFDIVHDRVVCKGLSMPHSPRWNDGKLWLLNSGRGEFGYVDLSTEKDGAHPFVACCFVPGYLRGLSFVDNRFAIVGSSDDRHEQTFQGLELGERLKEKGTTAKCAIYVVDLKSFDLVHELTFKKPITELYDIVVLPGVTRPKLGEPNQMSLAMHLEVESKK